MLYFCLCPDACGTFSLCASQNGDLLAAFCNMLLEMRVDTVSASKFKGQAVDLWSLLGGSVLVIPPAMFAVLMVVKSK